MPVDSSRLSRRELRMIGELVTACHYLEDIFWRQSDPEGLELYKSLEKSNGDPKLRRLLFINGSRFDLIDENKPFVGAEPMPAGRGLYGDRTTTDGRGHGHSGDCRSRRLVRSDGADVAGRRGDWRKWRPLFPP